MAYREFTDDDGVFWQVWETRPGDTANVRAPFAAGWLTFESTGGRLRLRPIPDDWSEAPDEALGGWLREAAAAGPVPQRDSPSPSETRAANAAAATTAATHAAGSAAPAAPASPATDAPGRPSPAPPQVEGGVAGNPAAADLIAALPASEAALLARTRAAVARAREVIRTIGSTVRASGD